MNVMDGQRDQTIGLGQDDPARDPAAGLESHLRSLILTNTAPPNRTMSDYPPRAATSNLDHQHHHPSSSYQGPTSPIHQRPNFSNVDYSMQRGLPESSSPTTAAAAAAAAAVSGQAVPSSPKTSRRRPNQAQRRQMNAQLTITPDVRPQPPFQSHHSDHFRPVHAHAPAPQYQRHMATNSQPSFSSWSEGPEAHRSREAWRRPSQPGMQNVAGYSSNSLAYAHPIHSAPTSNGGVAMQQHHVGTFQNQPRPFLRPDEISHQAAYLEMLCRQVIPRSEIERSEIAEKEAFRQRIERISREVVARHELTQNTSSNFPASSVELKCFGSLSSGFATKDSDMDLGLLSPLSKVQPDAPESPIPRLLEKALLDAGLGARLLSRTRVPIIKLCESPSEKLRQGLLEERQKWENGLDAERPEDVEDEQRHDSPGPGDDDEQQQDAGLTGVADVASPTDFEVPHRRTGEIQQFRLQQGPKNPLSSYFALTKRILRRAGSRDVTVMNERQLSDLDWVILQKVCQAFIRGLLDPQIRERMTAILSRDHDWNSRYHRSLAGLFAQVEGLKILQSWHEWTERHLFSKSLPQDEQELSLWETQSRSMTDAQPIQHHVNLSTDFEKIKRIPSVKLLLLEQGEDETPSQYYIRTQVITNSLEFDPEKRSQVQQEIVRRYVSGIHQEDVRGAISQYLREFPDHSNFQAVGCRHKSLHLARELERALNKNLYDVEKAASVAQYVDLLRSPLVKGSSTSSGFVVAFPPGSSGLIATIKTIEDPHGLSPNQPRDKYRDPLEFPKKGVGAQCDINFSAHLALQNTALLRCYAHTDPRVKPMVLFVKQWAKVRGINSGYRGTLSSYGYVLMVLHYLVNIAQPFVCPNLQLLAPKTQPNPSQAEVEATITCRGYDVQFWRNEQEILQFAVSDQLNNNKESIGDLLRGFFEYYAQNGAMSNVPKRGFDWGRDVVSLRTRGGLLTKQEKGWTGAKTVYGAQTSTTTDGGGGQRGGKHAANHHSRAGGAVNNNDDHNHNNNNSHQHHRNQSKSEQREIRLRYLFAIEDPFELDHNVARTVTHNGIVSIRDEFRRAWRLIRAAGGGNLTEDLLQDTNDVSQKSSKFLSLLEDIHGSSLGEAI